MKKSLLVLSLGLFFNTFLFSQTNPAGSGSHNLVVNVGSQNTCASPTCSGLVNCVDDCVTLTASYNDIGNTSSYQINSIPFNSPMPSFNNLANQIPANIDDRWSDVITMPFDFCFFDQTYNQLIISTNGAISFDIGLANSFHGWALTNNLPSNTDSSLQDGNIFGAIHDLNPGIIGQSEVGWQVFGIAPFRFLVLSYYEMPQYQCDNLTTTQAIVLYETTNVVEVYILNKPACAAWNGGRAVIGIQNPAGTIGYIPPGRNTLEANWTGLAEAWQFKPNGASSLTSFSWLDTTGTEISTSDTVQVCPTQVENYTAQVAYNACDGSQVFATKIITIDVENSSTNVPNLVSIDCNNTANGFATFNLLDRLDNISNCDENANVTFHLTDTDANNNTLEITNSNSFANTTNPQTIYARVENPVTSSFYVSSFVIEVVIEDASFTLQENCGGATATVIGNAGGTFAFNPIPTDGVVINAITGEITNATIGETYTVEYTIQNSCTSLEAVTITLEVPNINPSVNIQLCDDNVSDGITQFDLTNANSLILNGDTNVVVTYFVSETDAELGVNAIPNPTMHENTSSPFNQEIYVRVENTSGCFAISILILEVLNSPNVNGTFDVTVCDFAVIDLTTNESQITNGDTNLTISYFETQADANNVTNMISTPTNYSVFTTQIIWIRVENVTGCFVVSNFVIIVESTPTINTPTPFEVCDDDNDGFAQFDLSTKINEITNDPGVSVSFYSTLADAENQINELPFVYQNSSNPQTIYTRVSSLANSCYAITELELRAIDCTALGQIQLNAFFDDDLNGTFGANESNFMNGYFTYEVNNDGIINTVSSSTGRFTIISQDENNTYDVTYNLYSEFDNCYDITTALHENISVNNGSIVTYDFPVIEESLCTDLAVYLVNYNASPRPGFTLYNYLYIENLGQEAIASGTINFEHDALLTFNSTFSVNPNYTVTPTSTGFTLDFVNLLAGETEVIGISLLCPATVALGELVTNTAAYAVNDLDTSNNTSSLSEIVIGSYDPNDKMESHGGKIVLDDFSTNDYLYYTIRFQNVGTADAINVRIEDLLDADLDETSLRMVKASHDYVLTQTGNQLIWNFDNINLPSETDDEPNSHGFVYFKIKPKTGYAIGDIIPNTAEIYFDFNAPVITNTFNTEFVASLSVNEFVNNAFSLYPNPANNLVTIQLSETFAEKTSLTVFDIQGKQVINSNINENTISSEVNTSNLEAGMYFVKLKNSNSELVQKLIIE